MTISVGVHTLTTGTSGAQTTQNGSNFLYLIFDVAGQANHVIADSKGNSPTLRTAEIEAASAVGVKCYYKENGVGGSGHTWGISGGVAPSLAVIEIIGAATSSSVDIDFVGRSDTTPFTANNTTATSQADELWLSAIVSDSGTNPSLFVITGNGFTTVLESQPDGSAEVCGAVSVVVASATGTPDPIWTQINSTICAVGLITIKAAGAAAGTLAGRRSMSGPGVSPDKRTTFSARPLSRQVLGATVSLSGQSLTASQGSVAPAIAIALTGQANTSAQGTVIPAVAVSVNGQQVSGTQGSVSSTTTYSAGRPTASGPGISPDYLKLFQARRLSAVTPPTSDVSVSLSGQGLTSAQGSVVETISYSLAGQQASAAQGSIVGSTSYSLTGQAATTAQGAVAEAVSVGLTGQGLTGSQGVVSFSGDVARALVGQSMTVAQGLVSVTLADSLTGQQMSMTQGSINASASTISGVVPNRTVIMRGSDKTVILH